MRAVFAQNLVQLRQKAGISQRAAAEALQVSQALLSHYEKGIREPGLDFVVRAAEYYGVSADLLLGRQSVERQPRFSQDIDPVSPPSSFARAVEQELWDTMGILLDLLDRNYDTNVFCYAVIYLAEVLYELLRYFHRQAEDYDPAIYHLSEESFDSGAVASDLSWVRAQYIRALRQFKEQGGTVPAVSEEVMRERYGEAYSAMLTLLRLAGTRISRQDIAEGNISSALFAVPRNQTTPEEEDNQ